MKQSLLFLLALPAFGQFSSTARHIVWGPSLPLICSPNTGDVFFKTTASIGPYYCSAANTWTAINGGGGGSGTVTSFSAGTLSPIFTTSVANPTTTPALSFAISAIAAHKVLGNNTGASASIAAVQLACADLSDSATGCTNVAPANTTATSHQFFTAYTSATGAFTKAQPACADLSDFATGCNTIAPANTTATTHQFFSAYTQSTGAFTKAQPACSDLSDFATGCSTIAPANTTATSHNFFTAYTQSTGAFTKAQPVCADLSDAATGCTNLAPANTTATAHNFFSAYTQSTGVFTKAQPACADISDAGTACTVTAPANTASTAHNFFTAYTASSGAFTKAQPVCGDLSDAGAACTSSASVTVNGTTCTLGSSCSPTTSLTCDPFNSTNVCYSEEFPPTNVTTDQVGTNGWEFLATNGTIVRVASQANHFGLFDLRTAASTSNRIALYLGNLSQGANLYSRLDNIANWTSIFYVRVGTGTSNMAVRVCLVDVVSNSQNLTTGCNLQSVKVEYDPSVNSNWTFNMCSASCLTALDSGVAATSTTNWFAIRIRSTVAGTVAYSVSTNGGAFPADKTICPSSCTATGTMTTNDLSPSFFITTSDNVDKRMTIDAYQGFITGLTR